MDNENKNTATQTKETVEEREKKYLEWAKTYKRKIPDIIKEIDQKLQSKNDETLKELANLFKEKTFQTNYSNTNEISCMIVVSGIYDQEMEDQVNETILHKYNSFAEVFDYIKELKFLMWRTEFIRTEENLQNLLEFLRKSDTSVQTMLHMLHQISITPYTTTLNVANLYLELKNTSAAFRLLKYANELKPGEETVLCFMAQLCLSVNQVEAAKDCLEQILHPTQMAEKIGLLCGITDIHHKSVKTPYIGVKNGIKENKIAFITCVNDTAQYAECEYYINRLHIPYGYEIEKIPIYDARSMTHGYNKAMNQTDAKYKVYLHQDAFILEEDFLYYMLHTFNENEQIGMLGVCGVKEDQKSGIYYDKIDAGKLYSNEEVLLIAHGKYTYPKDWNVFCVDGVCMMTQYDLPWREDIFDGWDFYDISQSLEFQKAGYEVVVPYQETIRVLHDCNYPKLESYMKYRDLFLKFYKQENEKQMEEKIPVFDDKKKKAVNTSIKNFDLTFQKDKKKAFESVEKFAARELGEASFFYVQSAGRIWEEEQSRGCDIFLKECNCFSDIVLRYKEYEHMIRRVEFQANDADMDSELEKTIVQMPESIYAILAIVFEKGIKKELVLEKMLFIYERENCKEYAELIKGLLERQINE